MAMTRSLISLALILVASIAAGLPVSGQTRLSASRRKPAASSKGLAAAHEQAKNNLKKATEDYKESLRELLALRESSAKRSEDEIKNVKELFADGLISKKELDSKIEQAASARAQVAEVRLQLKGADQTLAETLAEAEAIEQISRVRVPKGGFVRSTAYIRYNGTASWSLLSMAGQVQSFFSSKFGHSLPVSAFGQSELHNRWRYNHSNAMDVGLHPDSSEGQALIAYLQSKGIPFMAFRSAVPGSASGPHIHIGQPSHKF
jgi:hypothetical protein